jgi:hypothetical protein
VLAIFLDDIVHRKNMALSLLSHLIAQNENIGEVFRLSLTSTQRRSTYGVTMNDKCETITAMDCARLV